MPRSALAWPTDENGTEMNLSLHPHIQMVSHDLLRRSSVGLMSLKTTDLLGPQAVMVFICLAMLLVRFSQKCATSGLAMYQFIKFKLVMAVVSSLH